MSVLPQVSTMLGLLGTVFGMIKTFQAVAASSEALGKTELLAKGIYEAWTATAGGILVAIPVMIAYHVLMGKVDARTTEIEKVATDWMENGGVPEEAPPAASRRSAPTIEAAVDSPPIEVAPA
jgi:biopolymer transport protein ExbB